MNRPSLGRTLIGAALTVVLSTFALAPASAASDPVVSWQSTITQGASYVYGQVPAAPTCTATVDLVATDCVVDGYAVTVGAHTLTAWVGGVPTTSVITYTVTGWTLKGFGKPVKMTGVNKVKAGATVPFKFKVYEGTVKAKSRAVVASFTAQRYDCTTLAAIGTPVPVASSKKGFTLKYRDGAFHQNWKTPKLPKAAKVKGKKPAAGTVCYAVTLTTQDASTLTANFLLK